MSRLVWALRPQQATYACWVAHCWRWACPAMETVELPQPMMTRPGIVVAPHSLLAINTFFTASTQPLKAPKTIFHALRHACYAGMIKSLFKRFGGGLGGVRRNDGQIKQTVWLAKRRIVSDTTIVLRA